MKRMELGRKQKGMSRERGRSTYVGRVLVGREQERKYKE